MTIDDLRDNGHILLECISGSQAYGLETPTSDVDLKGVFLLPKNRFYGLDYVKQVANPSNDIVFYELGRFMELLSVNNPNILELLNTPEQSVIYKNPILNQIDSRKIISKKCKDSFGKFAISQIKKAKGLNKKIVNPVGKDRKSPLDFCYVNHQSGSIPLMSFLTNKGWEQENCGLINIPYMQNIYGLYHSESIRYAGIVKSDKSNELSLSSIPRGEPQKALLYFNKNGYSKYCKDYRQYWEWVDNRNEDRYQHTQSHGKNYDSKNMMHTFRLLNMAIEIAREQTIKVFRNDREFLMEIRSGRFEYDELLKLANQKQREIEAAFEKSDLPEVPDVQYINEITYLLRETLYK
ncbi:MAG: nucleotidyltransferase domain-containing protein [Bacteroidota bacterium]